MNETLPGRDELPIDALLRIDEECDRFESAWLDGAPIDPRACLGGVANPARALLVYELLHLDLAYRRRRGDHPEPADYLGRFPDDRGAVEAAFAAEPPAQRTPPTPTQAGLSSGDSVTMAGARAPSAPVDPAVIEALASAGYEVLGELGRGGMGVVHLARKVALNRLCALKMILAGAEGKLAASSRFRAEAEAIARLRHPDIVQVYHVGEINGLPFLELEYLPGGSLDRELDGTPRPAVDSARLIGRVARAIAEAHRQGVVHRDLKPANILLDADGRPRVADFGLAKLLDADSALTRSQMVIGSPSYMAPEQAAGDPGAVGAATDVYALGAVLYELLTGRPPFRAASAMETLELVKYADPVPPSRLVPGLPRDAETICLKCLEKAPAARYATADAMADDLHRFAAGEPIAAHPPTPWARAGKWLKRRPALSTAMTVGGAAVALMVAAVLYYNHRLRDEVHRARTAEEQAIEQRNLALGAFQRLVYDVQDRLGDVPATRSIRQSLLNTAVDGLERLAAGAGAAKPDLARAVAHQRLGVLYRQVGRADEARRELEMAGRLAEDLLAASPRDLALRSCLRDRDTVLGEMLIRADRAPDARPLLRRAVTLGEEIVAAAPDDPGARRGLIEACFQCGRASGFSDEPREAEALYRRMRDLAARWVDDQPDSRLARNLLAMSHRKLGDSRKLDNDPEAARVEYAAAIELGRALLDAEPGNLLYQSQLAAALDDLGSVAMTQRRLDEARDLLREAEQLLVRTSRDDPDNVDNQVRLVLVHYHLGGLDRGASRFGSARGLFVRALDRLRRLDQQGKLTGMTAFRDEWIATIGRAIADCDGALALCPGP